MALEMLPATTAPELVERVRQDLEEMNRLISDTLDLARGLEPHAAERVDMRDFIDGVVTSLRQGLPLSSGYQRPAAIARWIRWRCSGC